MKLILKDGIHSKNSPKNTMDSIILTLNNNNIDGINITVQMTMDGIIVVYPTSIIMCSNINKIPYNELIKYNVGSKIKKHRILTLEEVLEKFSGSSKKLIIELNNCSDNLSLVKSVIELTSRYSNSNIYLKTSIKENILYLKELANTCNIGATILDSDNYFWNLDLDFYSINYSDINSDLVLKQLNSNKIIMLENINIKERLELLRSKLDNYSDNIYLITDNQKEIVEYFR